MKSLSTDGYVYTTKTCPVQKNQTSLEFNLRRLEKAPKATTLSSLVDSDTLLKLGPVDEGWFRNRLRVCESENTRDASPRLLVGDDVSPRKQGHGTESSFVTPLHREKRSKLFAPSPLLFSPEDNEISVSNRKKVHRTVIQDEWTTPLGYRPQRNIGQSPPTPACSVITPNQATAISQVSMAGSVGQPSPCFSPFPSWNPTHADDGTPVFMKRLFKTPQTLTRSRWSKSFTTPASDKKTPQRLSLSLGADLDVSNISWTSSLATPPASSSEKKRLDFSAEKSDQSLEDEECTKGQVTARALFTGDQADGNCDAEDESGIDTMHEGPTNKVASADATTNSQESPPLARMPDTESSDNYVLVLDVERKNKAGRPTDSVDKCGDGREGVTLDKVKNELKENVPTFDGLNSNIQVSPNSDNANNNNNFAKGSSFIDSAKQSTRNSVVDPCQPVEANATTTKSPQITPKNIKIVESPQLTEKLKTLTKMSPQPALKPDTSNCDSPQADGKQVTLRGVSPQLGGAGKLDAKPKTNFESSPGNSSNIAETLAFLFDTPPAGKGNRTLAGEKESKEMLIKDNENVNSREDSHPVIDQANEEIDSPFICKGSICHEQISAGQKSNAKISDNSANCKPETETDAAETHEHLPQGNRTVQPSSVSAVELKSPGVDCRNTTIDNGDLFSQMSPTFAEALALATDLASAKHAVDEQTGTSPSQLGIGKDLQDGVQGVSENVIGRNERNVKEMHERSYQRGATNKLASASPAHSASHGRESNPEDTCIASRTKSENLSRDDNALTASCSEPKAGCGQQGTASGTTPANACSKQESTNTSSCAKAGDPDSQTAVFKSISKSQNMKKFYYPSNRGAATRSHFQPKSLISRMRPVENSPKSTEVKTEKGGMTSDEGCSSINSSTPTIPRRSADSFVSFTAYMKTVEPQQTTTHAMVQKGHLSAPPISRGVSKYETPRTSRETATNSGLGCRRRVGNFYQPAAKKQKTDAVSVCGKPASAITGSTGSPIGRNKSDVSFSDGHPGSSKSTDAVQIVRMSVDTTPTGSRSVVCSLLMKAKTWDVSPRKNANELVSPHAALTTLPSTLKACNAGNIETMKAHLDSTSGFKTFTNKTAISESAICSFRKTGIETTQASKMPKVQEGNFYDANEPAGSKYSPKGACNTSIVYEQCDTHIQDSNHTATSEIYQRDTSFKNIATHQGLSTQFTGFSTASGGKIAVSESAMMKARKLISEVDQDQEDNSRQRPPSATGDRIDPEVSESPAESIVPPQVSFGEVQGGGGFGGFTSASGKNIAISDTAMKRAQLLLQQVDEGLAGASDGSASFGGFTSASGKHIPVSDTAMRKAKSLLDDIDGDLIPSESAMCHGFITAAEQSTSVRDSTVKKELSDCDRVVCETVTTTPAQAMTGFTSASGKSISVSDTAMRKAELLIADVDNVDSGTADETPFAGFASASGKNINISAAAMQKAKRLVSEIEMSETPLIEPTSALVGSTGRQSTKSLQTPQRDLRRLPKGFRPFKPPGKVGVRNTEPTKLAETPPHQENSGVTACGQPKAQYVGQGKECAEKPTAEGGNVEEINEDQKNQTDDHEESEALHDSFTEDFFSATQVKRELEAVEELEMQMAGITEDDLNNMNNDILKDGENSQDGVKFAGLQRDRNRVNEKANTPAQTVKETTTKEGNVSARVDSAGDGNQSVPLDSGENSPMPENAQYKSHPEGTLNNELDVSTDDEVFLNFDKSKTTSTSKAVLLGIPCVNSSQVREEKEEGGKVEGESVEGPAHDGSVFSGFQTASGHQVHISDESLAFAWKMMEEDLCRDDQVDNESKRDISKDDSNAIASTNVDSNVTDIQNCVQDGENIESATVLVEETVESCEALQADRSGGDVLNGGVVGESVLETDRQSVERSVNTTEFGGFQTASGQPVSVSEDSLEKARKLFSESEVDLPEKETIDFECISERDETGNTSPLKPFIGFQTASGNKVRVSKASLEKAKCLLADAGNADNGSFRENVTEFTGFQTAAGKKVVISEESLKKAKCLLDDEARLGDESKIVESNSIPGRFVDFQTAHGNKAHTSAEALKEARSVSKASDTEMNNQPTDTRKPVCPQATKPFLGFQTAGGSAVQISESSLRKARDFLCTVDDVNDTETMEGHFGGLKTASGHRVAVSDTALERAKDLLGDASTGLEANNPCTKTGIPAMSGFQTAAGTRVSVSEQSLEKARRLLAEDETREDQGGGLAQGEEMSLFKTASGSTVTVSASALNKAKEFIHDDVDATIPNPTKASVGFQTGSGKLVKVSAESISKAKRLLADTELSEHTRLGKDSNTRSGDTGTTRDETAGHLERIQSQKDGGSSKMSGCDSMKAANHGGVINRLPTKRTYQSTGLEEPPNKKANIATPIQGKTPRTQLKPLHSTPAGFIHDRTLKPTRSMRPLVSTPPAVLHGSSPGQHGTPGPALKSINQSVPVDAARKSSSAPKQQRIITGKAASFRTPFRNNAGKKVVNDGTTSTMDDKQVFCPPLKKSKADLNHGEEKGGGPEDTKTVVVELGRRRNSMPASLHSVAQRQPDTARKRGPGQTPKCSTWTAKAMQARKQDTQRTTVKPITGSLYSRRLRQPRIALHDMVTGQTPCSYTEEELYTLGVQPDTISVKCSNAENYRFQGRDHYSDSTCANEDGIPLTDGGVLHLDENGTAGKEQFLRALYSTPGVDSRLITEDWVFNHYRWIVWKLAAMEVAYPNVFAARYLKPDMVMLQLKYRYDREVDLSHRSAIKKMLERDDTPSRRLVLCVSAISVNTDTDQAKTSDQSSDGSSVNKTQERGPCMTLELTDGWYGVKTVIDRPLTKLVSSGKIQTGTKLCIYGAELIGSQDACTPLEAPSNLALKICANSTRRARYDARLGYQTPPHPYPVLLNTLYSDGGLVGCVDAMVVRCYPMQYVERLSDGTNVVRNSKSEQMAGEVFEREKQKRIEKLYGKIQEKFERQEATSSGKKTRGRSCSKKMTIREIEKLERGQEIYDAIQSATDPSSIEAYLSERQLVSLHSYRQSLNEKKQLELQAEFRKALDEQSEEFPASRNVTGIFKVRVTGHTESEQNTSCILTIWRPSEDVTTLLSEGARLKIYNLSTSAGRSRHGSSEIQLSSTRTTRYKQLPARTDVRDFVYQPRMPTDLGEMSSRFFEPAYNEVDVVGLVVFVSGLSGTSSGLQSVYIADVNQNLIAIKFWGGVQNQYAEDVMKAKNFIAAANLQWRSDDRSRLPCVYSGDLSVFTQKPRENHLKVALAELQNQIKDSKSFIENMKDIMDSVIFGKSSSAVTPVPDRFQSRTAYRTPVITPSTSFRSKMTGQGSTPGMERPLTPVLSSHRGSHTVNAATRTTPITGWSSRTLSRFSGNTNQGGGTPALKQNERSMPGNSALNTGGPVTPRSMRPGSARIGPSGPVTPVQPGSKTRLLSVIRRQDFGSHHQLETPDYLSRIPSPPPLSPLPSPVPQAVRRGFRPPSRSTTVTSVKKSQANIGDEATKIDVSENAVEKTSVAEETAIVGVESEDRTKTSEIDNKNMSVDDGKADMDFGQTSNIDEIEAMQIAKTSVVDNMKTKDTNKHSDYLETDHTVDCDKVASNAESGDGGKFTAVDGGVELKEEEYITEMGQSARPGKIVTVDSKTDAPVMPSEDVPRASESVGKVETADSHPQQEISSTAPQEIEPPDNTGSYTSTECNAGNDSEPENSEEKDALLALRLSQLDESLLLDAVPVHRVTRSQSRKRK